MIKYFQHKRWSRLQSKEFKKLISPKKRLSQDAIYGNFINDAVNSQPDIYDKEFAKDISARYFELEKNYYNIWLASFAIGAFLSSRFIGGSEVSLLGVSLKSPNYLREPLVFIISCLGMLLSLQKNQLDRMAQFLSAYSYKHSGQITYRIFTMKYAKILPEDIYTPSNSATYGINTIEMIFGFLFIAIYIMIGILIICLIGFISFLNVYDIYTSPSFSKYISYSVCLFCILSWIFGIIFLIYSKFPWKRSDYTIVNDLYSLSKIDPIAHEKRIREISDQASANANLKLQRKK